MTEQRRVRAVLELRADHDGSFSLMAVSSESERCIMSGLRKSEAQDIAQDVKLAVEQQLTPASNVVVFRRVQ